MEHVDYLAASESVSLVVTRRSGICHPGLFVFLLLDSCTRLVCCVSLMWLVGRTDGWRRTIGPLGLALLLMIFALVPYAWLLSKRAPNQTAVTILARTHAPDLLRIPLLLSAGVLIMLIALNRYGHFAFRRPSALFAISLLLLPLVLFNQQIVTGLSLQPTHYEVFVVNYTLLLAAVLITGSIASTLAAKAGRYFSISLVTVAALSLCWAIFEVSRSTQKFTLAFITRDRVTPAARRLADLRAATIEQRPGHHGNRSLSSGLPADDISATNALGATHVRVCRHNAR